MAKQSKAVAPAAESTASDGSEVIVPNEKVTNNTLLIEVATGLYPVSLNMIFEKFRAQNMSFSLNPPRVDIEGLGYAVVTPTIQPAGDVVTEAPPVLEDGVYHQAWFARPYNEDELSVHLSNAKIEATARVMTIRDDDFEIGMTYTVGEETFNVQLRVEDRVNILARYVIGKDLIAAGQSEKTIEFRTYENKSVVLTQTQVVEMGLVALEAVDSIYKTTWALKDQIDNAATLADLPEIPPTFITA